MGGGRGRLSGLFSRPSLIVRWVRRADQAKAKLDKQKKAAKGERRA